MQTETERFFSYIIKENRSVLEFINANYSFLDRRLADHYGMQGRVRDDQFQKVVFSGKLASQRGGLTAVVVMLLYDEIDVPSLPFSLMARLLRNASAR